MFKEQFELEAEHCGMPGMRFVFIDHPLGGISAAFMNFSIGFYIGGQVLAGTFLGEQTEYRVRIDEGPVVVVRQQNLGLNGSNPAAAPGAIVYLTWTPDASQVLPGMSTN